MAVRLEDHGEWTVGVEGGSGGGGKGGGVTLGTDGSWKLALGSQQASGPAGSVDFAPNAWHAVQLLMQANGSTAALLDGKALASVAATPGDGWRIKVSLSRYIFASMDNFTVTPL